MHCFYLSIILLVLSIDHCFEYKLWLLLKKTNVTWFCNIACTRVFRQAFLSLLHVAVSFYILFRFFFFDPGACLWIVHGLLVRGQRESGECTGCSHEKPSLCLQGKNESRDEELPTASSCLRWLLPPL